MVKVLVSYNLTFEEQTVCFQNFVELENMPWKEEKIVFLNSQSPGENLIINLPKKQKKYYYVLPNKHYSCVVKDKCENIEEFHRFRNVFKLTGWQLVQS